MEVQHGGLIIDVPEGWSDQSTLLFVAPRDSQTAATVAKVAVPTVAVAVRFRGSDGLDAVAVLAEELSGVRAADPDAVELEAGPFSCPLGAGAFRVVRLRVSQAPLVQITAAVVLGPVCVLATASAAEARFSRVRDELLRVLQSMRFS